MKKRAVCLIQATVLIFLVSLSMGALAAKPPNAGNGAGGGSGNSPPDYGDLLFSIVMLMAFRVLPMSCVNNPSQLHRLLVV